MAHGKAPAGRSGNVSTMTPARRVITPRRTTKTVSVRCLSGIGREIVPEDAYCVNVRFYGERTRKTQRTRRTQRIQKWTLLCVFPSLLVLLGPPQSHFFFANNHIVHIITPIMRMERPMNVCGLPS